MKPVPCTPEHIFCKANVVLAQKLISGREYNLKLTLKNSKGESTGPLDCSIRSTRHITHYQAQNLAFPVRPMPAMVPEDAKLKTKVNIHSTIIYTYMYIPLSLYISVLSLIYFDIQFQKNPFQSLTKQIDIDKYKLWFNNIYLKL